MVFFSLKSKAIVDITTGQKIGTLRSCDLKIDEKTGKIEALLMPKNRLSSLFAQESDYTEIPWEKILKIGTDTVIVEL